MSEPQMLDEKGFEFTDLNGRRYLVRMWGGDAWLCYKHPDGQWVSLRKLNQMEVWIFNEQAEKQQDGIR